MSEVLDSEGDEFNFDDVAETGDNLPVYESAPNQGELDSVDDDELDLLDLELRVMEGPTDEEMVAAEAGEADGATQAETDKKTEAAEEDEEAEANEPAEAQASDSSAMPDSFTQYLKEIGRYKLLTAAVLGAGFLATGFLGAGFLAIAFLTGARFAAALTTGFLAAGLAAFLSGFLAATFLGAAFLTGVLALGLALA